MLNKNIFCIKKVSLFLSMGIFIVKTFFFGYLCFINVSFIFQQMERNEKYCFIVNPDFRDAFQGECAGLGANTLR